MDTEDNIKFMILTEQIKRYWREIEKLERFDYNRDEIAVETYKQMITELHQLRGQLHYD